MKHPTYYLYGETPVSMVVTPEGGLRVLAYDHETRSMIPDTRFRSWILHDRDGLVQEIDEVTFTRLTTVH